MKDSRGLHISKVYDLTKFDDQLSLYRQFCAYISNKPSTSTMSDFSNIQKIQDTVERKGFFTSQCSKRLFIDMRDSLGITGKNDPLKPREKSIKIKISLHEVETVVHLFGYRIVKDRRDKKLDELAYNYRQSRKRKLMDLDRDIVWEI